MEKIYRVYPTKIDFLLGTELFLWINSISTCFLQLWVCKHKRIQRCLTILIIQLISNCLTTLLVVTVQAGIVQTIIAIMTRHGKALQHANARIFYIVTDHILQIFQWGLNICSLGAALTVLDRMETENGDFVEGTDNPTFVHELQAPSMRELLTIERCSASFHVDCSCNIFRRSADINYMWGERQVSFDEDTSEVDCNISTGDSNDRIIRQGRNTDERDDNNIRRDDNSANERNAPDNGSRISYNSEMEYEDNNEIVCASDRDSDRDNGRDNDMDDGNVNGSNDISMDDDQMDFI
ncbi:hypothetical protein LOAG_09205 [Loa loa]|uniref:Uncharacterized protein n=2 Tax=Loa loa TaxID=7209 RepID=A0A1S0TSJ8_LOALO|nr:hypothetical protein LOAG_09205 [Loa loa]EFO19287.1 hypothetical protein LOAG_09205 [Loa loa]